MSTNEAVLCVDAPDRKGLVAAIAGFLSQHDANIVAFDEHVSPTEARFFARVVFEMDGLVIGRDEIEPAFAPLARRYEMNWALHFSDSPVRVGLLVSRHEHCLYDLLWRHRAGELPIQIPIVLSNHAELAEVAKFFDIPFEYCPILEGDKDAQERVMLNHLRQHDVHLVVLARYMQILGPQFLHHYHQRVINIHHSFLPAFIGGRPYHQAYERGVKLIGATAHYATDDLDEGPIIEQDVCRVTHSDGVETLVRIGRDIERTVLARAVRMHAEHRVIVHGRRTIVFA